MLFLHDIFQSRVRFVNLHGGGFRPFLKALYPIFLMILIPPTAGTRSECVKRLWGSVIKSRAALKVSTIRTTYLHTFVKDEALLFW